MGSRKIKNNFVKGLNTDFNNEDKPNSSMDDALNIRLSNEDGQGYLVTNIKGHDVDQKFSLTPGYQPLGYETYNGVAYIVSYSSYDNLFEIGSFPSPIDPLNCTVGGWEKVYKPFYNYLGNNNTRQEFRTDLLNIDGSRQFSLTIRANFDDTVSVFMADYINPIRVIKSGFDYATGECKGDDYSDDDFPNSININFESIKSPTFAVNQILDSGGSLLPGNYFVYLRYQDDNQNSTSFVKVKGSYQISMKRYGLNDIFLRGNNSDELDVPTTKHIQIRLEDLDPAYNRFEIAYVRYYGEGLRDAYLVANPYVYNGASNFDVSITGNELVIESAEDLLNIETLIQSRKTIDDVAKSICQVENRLFAGNIKRRKYNNTELSSFALNISIEGDDSTISSNAGNLTDGAFFQHQKWEQTFNETGYFRGEAYQFGVRFRMKDGYLTDAFPLKGADDILGFGTGTTNNDGIYRFPLHDASPLVNVINDHDDELNLLGVKFSIDGTSTTDYIRENVDSIEFVRKDRDYSGRNLLCQGLSLQGKQIENVDDLTLLDGLGLNLRDAWERSDDWVYEEQNINVNGILPMIGFQYPLQSRSYKPGQSTDSKVMLLRNHVDHSNWNSPWEDRTYASSHPASSELNSDERFLFFKAKANHHGIFSNDYSIDSGGYSGDLYIQKVSEQSWRARDWDTTGASKGSWQSQIFDKRDMNGYTNVVSSEYNTVDTVNTINNTPMPKFVGGFPIDTGNSWINTTQINNTAKIKFKNIDLDLSDVFYQGYIGVELDPLKTAHSQPANYYQKEVGDVAYPDGANKTEIVNVYRTNPFTITDVTTLYTVNDGKLYRGISNANDKTYSISEIDGNVVDTDIYWDGDCFLQQQPVTVYFNGTTLTTASEDAVDSHGDFFSRGMVVLVAMESYSNIAMAGYPDDTYLRVDSSSVSFDPYLRQVRDKTFYLNKGYNITTDRIQGVVGVDIFSALFNDEGRFLTRILFSKEHVPNSSVDYYKQIDVDAYRDYNFQYGQINSVIEKNGVLFSVQETCINQHNVNERALMDGGNTATLRLGDGEILSKKTRLLSDEYGTQHQWSIVKSGIGFYGVDFNRRKIWGVVGGNFQQLSDSKVVNRLVLDYFERTGNINPLDDTISDVTNPLDDLPVFKEGIVGFYNRKFNEIGFTLIHNNGTLSTQSSGEFNPEYNEERLTLLYNEKLQVFGSRATHHSPFYLTINEDMYSFSPFYLGSSNNPTVGSAVRIAAVSYLHDINDNRNIFYPDLLGSTAQSETMVSVVVNTVNGVSDIEKVFDFLHISSNDVEFDKISFETEYQKVEKDFITGENFYDPLYKENEWKMPIPRSDSQISGGSHYLIKSILRGKYCKITLTLKKPNPIWIKAFLTGVRESKI